MSEIELIQEAPRHLVGLRRSVPVRGGSGTGGSQADSVASLRQGGRFSFYFGIFFAFLGGVFVLIAGAILAPKR